MNPSSFVLAAVLAAAVPKATAADDLRIVNGPGQFEFTDQKGDATRSVTVFTYQPRRTTAATAPILFVMHGFHRSAKAYRDDWAYHADKHGFMVVAPLFEAKTWGSDYSYPSSKKAGAGQTSFHLIEHLFDAIKAATGNASAQYFIYGFSEGGQFVHRLVLTLPEARYARAVIGTPGWYTMPDFDTAWPYGLKHTQTDRVALKRIFERDVVLLLGEKDNDPNHPDLSKKAASMAEGLHRVARGQNFFRQAEARAKELHANFAWRLQMVPGVAHEPKKMSPTAAANVVAALRP